MMLREGDLFGRVVGRHVADLHSDARQRKEERDACHRAELRGLTGGGATTCALDAAGALGCFGAGESGQLGSGDAASSMTPRLVELGED